MINAGYRIIQMERTSMTGDYERGYAIAKAINPETPSQWVTWWYQKDRDISFYYGNYFSVERMAYHDFYRRLMKEYEL